MPAYQPTDIYPGDRIPDPMDEHNLRIVDYTEAPMIYMTDGGVMGMEEVEEIILESEVA